MNQIIEPLSPSSPEPERDTKGLHRHKKRRSRRQHRESILVRYRLPIGLLLTLLIGILFLMNPWYRWIHSFSPGSSTLANLIDYFVYRGGSELLGGVFLLAALSLGVIYIRRELMYSQRLWRRSGCPRCGRDDLRRTSRIWRDRLLNRIGIPVRRYICADCRWQGARIDESHL